MREGGIQQFQLFRMGHEPEPDRGRVDERVGPTELERIDAFLEAHLPGLADQGEVFGVVDRQLHGIPRGTVERSTLLWVVP